MEDTYKGQVDNPLTLNRYTYVHNNPLRFIDPTGNKAVEYASVGGGGGGVSLPMNAKEAFNIVTFGLLVSSNYLLSEMDESINSDEEIKLNDKQRHALERGDNSLTHLDEDHLEAYEGDLLGKPILRKDGRPYDHKKEVENAERGLRKSIDDLSKNVDYLKKKGQINKSTEQHINRKLNNYREKLNELERVRERVNKILK